MAMIPAAAAAGSSAASPKEDCDDQNNNIQQDHEQGWVLHDNPLYSPRQEFTIYKNSTGGNSTTSNSMQLHHHPLSRRLPLSARAIAASFWGLTRPLSLSKAVHNPGIDEARCQIVQLKAELELERRMQEKTQCLNKKLAKELEQERRGKEEAERARSVLVEEIEEERKMLRMAEGFKEERIQMKLAEANLFYQNRLASAKSPQASPSPLPEVGNGNGNGVGDCENLPPAASKRSILKEKNNEVVKFSISVQRKASPPPEPENPHIKRGIKGFVEFPRVVKAIGSKNKNKDREVDAGTIMKLECQKAQLRILLRRQRSAPLQSVHTPNPITAKSTATR